MLAMLAGAALAASVTQEVNEPAKPQKRDRWCGLRKVGRNEPCPCESGKKYKKCCGSPLNGSEKP